MAEDCGEILRQEQATAQKVEGLIDPITRTYLQREAADQTAAR
jgi:hypothetical protein